MNRPGRYNGIQSSDIGVHNNVVMLRSKILLEALKILGLRGRSSTTLLSLYSCTRFISSGVLLRVNCGADKTSKIYIY